MAAVREPFHLLFIFLASVAVVTNVQKTFARARAGGLESAGGWLAHVGVGVILLGIVASSAYDQSTKVTLVQGVPQKVGDLKLTFNRLVPRVGRQKERMEVKVVRPGGGTYLAYPKLFVNDRTRQLMANPHVRSIRSRTSTSRRSSTTRAARRGRRSATSSPRARAWTSAASSCASKASTSRPAARTRSPPWRAAAR